MAKDFDSKQCENCDAKCCRYIGVPLDDPETAGDFDDLVWFLYHENTYIYVEDDDWYLNIDLKCRMLDENDRCKVYEKRPRICRKHKLDECEFDDKSYDHDMEFRTPESMQAYARKFLREKYGKKKRRKTKKRKKTTRHAVGNAAPR